MTKPTPDTALYNHPLAEIEEWLREMGCEQNRNELNTWYVEKASWKAEIEFYLERINVRYINAGNSTQDIKRSFKYSLSRQNFKKAVSSRP